MFALEYNKFVAKEQEKGTTLIPSYMCWLENELLEARTAMSELALGNNEDKKKMKEEASQ